MIIFIKLKLLLISAIKKKLIKKILYFNEIIRIVKNYYIKNENYH